MPWLTPRSSPRHGTGRIMMVNLSGRGDKDIHTVAAREGITV